MIGVGQAVTLPPLQQRHANGCSHFYLSSYGLEPPYTFLGVDLPALGCAQAYSSRGVCPVSKCTTCFLALPQVLQQCSVSWVTGSVLWYSPHPSLKNISAPAPSAHRPKKLAFSLMALASTGSCPPHVLASFLQGEDLLGGVTGVLFLL